MPIACLAIEPDQPYSTEHGSILGDLINRVSHGHGLYIYLKLEEATCGTSFTDSNKSFACAKNGRVAFLALTMQYAGKDLWEAQIKAVNLILFHLQEERIARFSSGEVCGTASKHICLFSCL